MPEYSREEMKAMIEMGICEDSFPLDLKARFWLSNTWTKITLFGDTCGWNTSGGGWHYRGFYLIPSFVGIDRAEIERSHQPSRIVDLGVVYAVIGSVHIYNDMG